MTGRLIFLTMTALPESDAATSFDLKALFSKSRLIESATAVPSMIAPSTMLSGGIGSMAKATTLKLLPTGLSSTALTALDPMSRPTTAFDFPKPNTVMSLKQVVTRKADTNLNWREACQFRVMHHDWLTFLSANHRIVRFTDPLSLRFFLSARRKGV